jgi:hypothetical protein
MRTRQTVTDLSPTAGTGATVLSLTILLVLSSSVYSDARGVVKQEFLQPVQDQSEPCPCAQSREIADAPGIIWRGCRSDLTLPEIAAMLAPVLWFSADEPFIVQGDRALPHAHPCDASASGGVVYYQVPRLRLRGSERVAWPEDADPEFVRKVEAFTIRYHFYYQRDFGVGQHLHDFEATDMHVVLEQQPSGCLQVRLTRVIGLAHGVDWYANELVVEPDTRLPITILVEEGKHASAPDRNADGQYTPGYDVNRRVYDAWGVRDVLGSGFLLSSEFRSSMFKIRRPGFRSLPPNGGRTDPSGTHSASVPDTSEELGTYELRPGAALGACTVIPAEHDALLRMMRGHRFGADFGADQYQVEFLHELAEPLSGPRSLIPDVSARWDRGIGVSFMLRGLDLREAYLVPRFNWVGRNISAEVLFTRTAAQFSSWYLSSGIVREYRPSSSEDGSSVADWKFVAEVGAKFRAQLTGRRRAFALGYDFAGLRLGVRSSGFDTLQPIRLIVEVGAGVW